MTPAPAALISTEPEIAPRQDQDFSIIGTLYWIMYEWTKTFYIYQPDPFIIDW